MNWLGSGILIPFFRSVALSRIVHLFFAIAPASCLSISIALCCPFAIACAFVDYCIATYTFVDGYTSTPTIFSSLTSVYVIYASTKSCSTTLSSSNSTMNIVSINVALGPIYYFTCQLFLLLRKNSTACFNSIYNMNYCLHKLHLFIV